MQLLGILIVMCGIFAGYTFTKELAEYETRRRRVERQKALFHRHPVTQSRQVRVMHADLFDQDAG